MNKEKIPDGNRGLNENNNEESMQFTDINNQVSQNIIFEIAKEYVARGWSVIPLKYKDKMPALQAWKEYQSRLPTMEELALWFDNGTPCNIGIVTGPVSGLAVIDIDSLEALAGAEALGLPDDGPVAKTGNGWHYYCAYPAIGIRNQCGHGLPGIDIRGEGGYIVAPPSTHVTGQQYMWLNTPNGFLAALPEWVTEKCKTKWDENSRKQTFQGKGAKSNYAQKAFDSELFKLSQASKGGRNEALNKAAFSLGQLVAGDQIDRAEVEMALEKMALSIGLGEQEAKGTIKSGLEAGIKEPRTKPENERTYQAQEEQVKEQQQLPKLRTGAEIRNLDIKIEWLIDGIIPKGAVTLLFGRGGIGKTTLALQLCNAIASGNNFLGVGTQKVAVIYVDYENSLAILSERLKTVGADQVLFWTASEAPACLDKNAQAYFGLLKSHPEAIFVFDTLRSSQGGDENDSRSMAFVMQTLRQLRDMGATVVLLHHTTKGSDSTYKGSTAIFDLVDHVIGLYPVKAQGDDKEFDDDRMENSDRIFRFGTKDKTRFQPFTLHLQFDEDRRFFVPVSDPINQTLDQMRALIPKEGIIQGELLPIFKNKLNIGQKTAQRLLKQGTGQFWTADKNTKKNNAILYKPFCGFDHH